MQGDNLASLGALAAAGIQVDSVVTDPPYGLAFMGKRWDYNVPNVEFWRAVYAVLKPGGHVLSFGGTRTYHRMACALEDAGFEIRDQLAWIYGSGFPKSLDVSKAIDKAAGAKRRQVAVSGGLHKNRNLNDDGWRKVGQELPLMDSREPATPAARAWDGYGTGLKPACEPIALARKPLGKNTVAANVLAFRTGALNIDGCRIDANGDKLNGGKVSSKSDGWDRPWKQDVRAIEACKHRGDEAVAKAERLGRWPANVLLDADAAALLDAQSGTSKSPSGGASRFFYCAKASARERAGSQHPTVKPLALMRYLCRLVTPPGGTVLDPFAGSGTTGEAALLEGFSVILMERERTYAGDIRQRLARRNAA